jgi:hypothetical protein
MCSLVRSWTAKGVCLHESVQGLNLYRRSVSGLEPEMPVTIPRTVLEIVMNCMHYVGIVLIIVSYGCFGLYKTCWFSLSDTHIFASTEFTFINSSS